MATPQYNHTQASIEETLSSAQYGKRMIRLASQFRRQGNHDAANAALMGAVHVRDQITRVIHLLPSIAPEHAALLNQTQRRHLTARLAKSHQEMTKLVAEHDISGIPPEACDQRCENWYASCLHIGHLTHLARSIVARAGGSPPDDETVEMTKYALYQLEEGARDSMADLRNNDLPVEAPHPHTRNKLRQQADRDHASIEEARSRLNEAIREANAQADNSRGRCHLCGREARADDAAQHVRTCLIDQIQKRYTIPEMDERYARNQPIIIWVRSEQRRHWVVLAVQPTTSLRQLDQFLRNHWLECCGHMSHFQVGNVQYSACVSGPGDPPWFDTDLAEPDEQHMVHTIEESITPGQRFQHEFDYGHTTNLDLEHLDVIPVPYEYLGEFINPPQDAQGHIDDFIAILARNQPVERCFTCTAAASWRYYENPYIHISPDEEELIVAPPYFCNDCIPGDKPMVPLRNSPRTGVGCYDNTHTEPQETPEPRRNRGPSGKG